MTYTAAHLKALVEQYASTNARMRRHKPAQHANRRDEINAEIDRLYAADAVAEKVYPAALVEAYVKAAAALATRAQTMLVELVAHGGNECRPTANLIVNYMRAASRLDEYARSKSPGANLGTLAMIAGLASVAPYLFAHYLSGRSEK